MDVLTLVGLNTVRSFFGMNTIKEVGGGEQTFKMATLGKEMEI